jgi:hypothetical protein
MSSRRLSWLPLLGESRVRAEDLLGCARELQTRLPGTKAALLDGSVSRAKADIILRATQFLDASEAAAAEEKVLGRAGRLIPYGGSVVKGFA